MEASNVWNIQSFQILSFCNFLVGIWGKMCILFLFFCNLYEYKLLICEIDLKGNLYKNDLVWVIVCSPKWQRGRGCFYIEMNLYEGMVTMNKKFIKKQPSAQYVKI